MKLLEKFSGIRAKTSQIMATIKEVNAILRSINRYYVTWKWFGASTSAITPLFKYLLVGLSFQTIYENLMEFGKVDSTKIYLLFGAMVVFYAIVDAFQIWRRHQETIFDNNLDDSLEEKVINHLETLDMARLSDPTFIELKDNAENRGYSSVKQIFNIELSAISDVVSLILTFGTLVVINWYLLPLLILPVIPRVIRSIKIEQKSRALWESQHATRRRKRLFMHALNDGHMLIMMRLLNFGTFIRENYQKYLLQLRDEQNEQTQYERNSDLWMLLPSKASGAIIFFILLQQVFSGSISIPALFVIMGTLNQFPSSLFGFLNTGVKLRSETLDYEYLQQLLATKPIIDESEATSVILKRCPTITAENLSFSYPRQDKLALRNCSVQIRPGEKVAIVGTNGSGKTTLAKLLAKVYLPDEGDIEIDSLNLRYIKQRSWINHTLYLGQQFRILELNVDYAIAGKSLEEVDQDRFDMATAIAGTDDFILPLKDGYKTQIGEQWPDGTGFSGGQLQRLALASAIYRLLDPQVCLGIFDEPMSDCDIETRENYYRSITQKLEKKTVVVIAHDPLFLHYFERVIVMEKGKIISDLSGADIKTYQTKVIQPG